MNWVETPESSNITRFRYDESSNILTIEFQNGGTYEYFDVPLHVFQEMCSAASKGQYLAQYIKGSYRYARA